MAIALAALLITSAFVAPSEKFIEISSGLVIRYPQKAFTGKNFNIGIYVADSLVETNPEDGSGGDYDLAELYISVSGQGTCVMWNDWFE